MKIIWGILLTSSLTAAADTSCKGSTDLHGASDAQVSGVIQSCQKDSQAQGREHLSSWVEEQVRNCAGLNYGPENRGSYLECISQTVASAENVLTCTSSPERYKQAVEHDVTLIGYTFKENAEVEVPEEIQTLFLKLAKAAEAELGVQFSQPEWKLRGFANSKYAASAGAGGRVVASSALWSGAAPLAEDEIAAILSHEISHVLREHSVLLGCQAVEWIGAENTIAEASQTFHEDLSEGYPRKAAWKSLSQKLEYEADHLALGVLARAGYDPQAMGRALAKLIPQASGGFSRGSHPDMEDRIRAVSNKAQVVAVLR